METGGQSQHQEDCKSDFHFEKSVVQSQNMTKPRMATPALMAIVVMSLLLQKLMPTPKV